MLASPLNNPKPSTSAIRRRSFEAGALLAVMLLVAPTTLNARDAHVRAIEPWSEAVVSVEDLEESSRWLIEHGGWRITSQADVARSELEYYNLPKDVTAVARKICAPKADTGCIRYIRFDGVADQRPIRPAARAWDTGGIFSIMLRSKDTGAAYDAAIGMGWWAESEPYRFSFGGSDLVNVVVQGPHGVNYALYERETPPFTAFPVGPLSQAFNSMRMVKDQAASLSFYRDTLGFGVLFDAPFIDPEARSNNFSVPANLATTLVRRAAVAQPVLPGETGRVEVMQFEGFEGRDFSAYASPPNLGIISVRYPARNFEAYREHLEGKGVKTVYSSAARFAVRDPDGNLTEFYDAQ